MKTIFIIRLVLCLLLVAACKPSSIETDPVVRIPFNPSETIDMGKFIEKVHYVQLENHPESAFTDIDKLIVHGPYMFMLDKRLEAVFCFDTAGKFRYRIQRVGRGPGEYQELEAFWLDRDKQELWLQSFWPPKIMVYNYDGKMLREFKIRWPAKDMIKVGDNLITGYNNSRSNDGIDSLQEGLFLLGPDGKACTQTMVMGDSSMYWSLAYQRHLSEYGDGALLLSQSDTIFKINGQGKVIPDVYLDWGKLTYPEDLRTICFGSPRSAEAFQGKYISGKDQLIAFGPIRLFRVFFDSHMELAIADLNAKTGLYSTGITSSVAKIPLLNPFAKSDQNELIGIYDMSLLYSMKESMETRQYNPKSKNVYQELDSLVESALIQDRPVLWFAKIKQEWLSQTY